MQTRTQTLVVEEKKKAKGPVVECQRTTSRLPSLGSLLVGSTAQGGKVTSTVGGTAVSGASANVTAAEKEEIINDLARIHESTKPAAESSDQTDKVSIISSRSPLLPLSAHPLPLGR